MRSTPRWLSGLYGSQWNELQLNRPDDAIPPAEALFSGFVIDVISPLLLS